MHLEKSLEHCMHLLIGESCHNWISDLVNICIGEIGECVIMWIGVYMHWWIDYVNVCICEFGVLECRLWFKGVCLFICIYVLWRFLFAHYVELRFYIWWCSMTMWHGSDFISTSTSPVIDELTQHLQGELPSYKPELQTASETVPEIAVSENQQQTLTQQELAPELCTAIIIHPLFESDSPLDSASDTTSYEQAVLENQTVSNTSLVSEDQPFIIQPINIAKSDNIIHHDYTPFFNRPSTSNLEPILEPVLKPASDDNTIMHISDSDDEDIEEIIVTENLVSPETPTPQITVSPLPTILL